MPHQTRETKEENEKIIDKFKTSAHDTGSPEVQVALLSHRISELTSHLRTHKKDFSSQRGLMKAVGTRRRLLDYLKGRSSSRYLKLIEALELRK